MIKEQENVSQHEGEHRRRWFYSPEMDLTLWVEDDGSPYGFQLSYSVSPSERKLLTWLPEQGFTHETLDEGEGRPFRYKMTPVAVPDGVFEQDLALARFLEEASDIDPEVRGFVAAKIRQYGE
jgi:hypothetical protein